MDVRDYDPCDGQAFQGDVAIIPIPGDIAIAADDDIPPINGRLIVQRGELMGHHHAIYLLDNVPRFRDDGRARAPESAIVAGGAMPHPLTQRARAHLYRDPAVARQMVRRRLLTRSDLAMGCLVVEGGPVVVKHEEHDGIRIPPASIWSAAKSSAPAWSSSVRSGLKDRCTNRPGF